MRDNAWPLRTRYWRAGELVRALQKASSEFAELWDRHKVARCFADHKTIVHPELGSIELDCQALLTGDHSQSLLILTAPPRSEGAEKLQLLAVLGHEHFPASASTSSAESRSVSHRATKSVSLLAI